MSRSTLQIKFRSNYETKDKKKPLYLYYTAYRQTSSISLNISLSIDQWDEDSQEVINTPYAEDYNKIISKTNSIARKIYFDNYLSPLLAKDFCAKLKNELNPFPKKSSNLDFYQFIAREIELIKPIRGEGTIDNYRNLIDTVYGFDIDPTMIRIGLMNLMMHGISQPKIDYTDTLSKNYNQDNFYDIVLANPPFTGRIDKGFLNDSFTVSTTKSELLFVERIYKMLRIGGTAGVIVPQRVLFGSDNASKDLWRILIEKCELRAVVSMPSGIFKPYAGVATAILIFTKGGETRDVWFYDMQSDGKSLDDKRNDLKKADGTRNYGDLHEIIGEFRKKEKNSDRTQHHFVVPKAEIIDNGYDLSINKYREEVYEEIMYEKPEIILDKLEQLENKIQQGIKNIKELF